MRAAGSLPVSTSILCHYLVSHIVATNVARPTHQLVDAQWCYSSPTGYSSLAGAMTSAFRSKCSNVLASKPRTCEYVWYDDILLNHDLPRHCYGDVLVS